MPILQLTICAKPVRQTVGEHGLTATRETKTVIMYILTQHSVL